MLRRLYDWTLAKAAHPYAAGWLALFAFLEASVFPVPPHPLLGLMCLAEPKKALRYAALATIASVAGGFVGYEIGHLLFGSVGQKLIDLLGLTKSFPEAVCLLRGQTGFLIIVAKGATPIPYKLITITAGFIGMPLGMFMIASLISRSISFMIVGVLFRLFGAPIKAFIDKYLVWVVVGFVALVVGGVLAVTLLGHGGKAASNCHPAAVSAAA